MNELNITAYFNQDIKKAIKEELLNAKESICIVVAWFTDEELFNIVCEKLENKEITEVILIIRNDYINNSIKGLNFQKFIDLGGNLYYENSLHHKFCIIDTILITGSYNWTYFGSFRNKENIVIAKGAEIDLINQYVEEVNNIIQYLNKIDRVERIDEKDIDVIEKEFVKDYIQKDQEIKEEYFPTDESNFEIEEDNEIEIENEFKKTPTPKEFLKGLISIPEDLKLSSMVADLFKAGKEAYYEKKYDRAIEFLNEAIENKEKITYNLMPIDINDIYYFLSLTYWRKKNYIGAETYIKKIDINHLEDKDKILEYKNLLGLIYSGMRKIEARDCFQYCIDEDEYVLTYYWNMYLFYLDRNRNESNRYKQELEKKCTDYIDDYFDIDTDSNGLQELMYAFCYRGIIAGAPSRRIKDRQDARIIFFKLNIIDKHILDLIDNERNH